MSSTPGTKYHWPGTSDWLIFINIKEIKLKKIDELTQKGKVDVSFSCENSSIQLQCICEGI